MAGCLIFLTACEMPPQLLSKEERAMAALSSDCEYSPRATYEYNGAPTYKTRTEGQGYDPLACEQGELDTAYRVGDLRRYGVQPDNPVSAHRLQSAFRSAAACAVILDVPAGFYDTDWEITESHLSARFAPGVEISGIFHVMGPLESEGGVKCEPIQDVQLIGPVTLYDRLGIINAMGVSVGDVLMKSDRSKNRLGSAGRGVHLYWGARHVSIASVTVEDTAPQSERPEVHAAVAIDGHFLRPEHISIGRIDVLRSQAHGVYIMGRAHSLPSVHVGAFGESPLISRLIGATLDDSLTARAVWDRSL